MPSQSTTSTSFSTGPPGTNDLRHSYVDATSFAVMRHLGISDALAFDGDFSAAGFVELRP